MNDITWHTSGNVLVTQVNETEPPEGVVSIWPIGQCGFIIKSGHTAIGIDLVLSELYDSNGKPRRLFHPPFAPDAGLHLDALLVSHNHKDHLDIPTIRGIVQTNPLLKVFLPGGIKQESGQFSQPQFVYLSDYETLAMKDFTITAVPVAHESYVYKDGSSISMGYALTTAGKRLFHSGDALADSKLRTWLLSFHPDLLFLPINGRDEERHSNGIIGNMSSEEAIALANDTKALLIPMHYDFFSNNGYDVERFKQEADEAHIPTLIPRLGKEMDVQ